MNKNFTDKVETIGKILIVSQIVYNLFIKFFIDVVGLPYALNYLTDVLMVLAFLCAGIVFIGKKQKINFKIELLILAGFLICGFIGCGLNKEFSSLLFIWAVRNMFRFFAFWISCIVLLNKEDFSKILKIVYISFWIHAVVCTIQFFGFGIMRDNLNGIFGTRIGYNTYSNVLICVITVYALVSYIYDKFSFRKFILTLLTCGYLTGISEIKIYWYEILILGICIVVLSLPKKKLFPVFSVLFLSCTLSVGATLLIYPEFRPSLGGSDGEFVTNYVSESSYGELYEIIDEEAFEIPKESLLYGTKEINGKTVTVMKHLNRGSGVVVVFKEFLTSWGSKLFGLGIGNTQESSVSVFNSPFAQQWSKSGYMRFGHIHMLLEHGIIGTLLYILFFISVFVKGILLKIKNQDEILLPITTGVIVFCGLLFVYDKALWAEGSAYLIFLLLAVPFVLQRKEKKGTI